MLEEVIKNV